MIGQKFNFLTVLKKDTERKYNYYICECECGKFKSIRKDDLIKNSTKSCGCKKKELHKKAHTRPTNTEFFTNPSDELAYFLGFFLADGYMTEKGMIGIQLHEQDVDILRKFSHLICGEDRLQYIKKKYESNFKRSNQYRLIFTNNEVYNLFLKLGFDTKKTTTAKVPTYLENNSHFWRGMIDGDGCLAFTSTFLVELVGTRSVCNSFKRYCQLYNLGIDRSLTEFNRKKKYNVDIVSFRIHGKEAYKLCQVLYENKGDLYLERKYNKYLQELRNTNVKNLNIFLKELGID
jgi:hypothetical protein